MIPRLRNILKAVADYYTLTRAQIQQVTGDTNDRVMRKHLQQLVGQRYLNKTGMEVVNPGDGAPAPVYFPSRKGAEYLAAEVDERYLHVCTQTPNWQHLRHWTTVSQFHIVLDQAVALQEQASVRGWLGEWDIANPDEKAPEKRFRLFTLLTEKPRLVCNPDAGFVLCVRSFAKTYYAEIDRETTAIQAIAHSKTPGYVELAKRKGHKKHFEATNIDTFGVLSISPTRGRRDLLRKAIKDWFKKVSDAIREKEGEKKAAEALEGAKLWKFACWPDFTPEKALFEPIWHPCDGDAAPLVKGAIAPKTEDLAGSCVGSGGDPPRIGVRT